MFCGMQKRPHPVTDLVCQSGAVAVGQCYEWANDVCNQDVVPLGCIVRDGGGNESAGSGQGAHLLCACATNLQMRHQAGQNVPPFVLTSGLHEPADAPGG